MRSDFLLVFGLLAAAGPVWATQRCGYPDNCFAKAKACPRECSSFLRATVTPCPVTQTISKTTTVTTSPVRTTTVVTNTVTATDSFSTVVTSSSTTTLEHTLTETPTTTSTTTTTTTTTIQTTPISVPLEKRAAASLPFAEEDLIEARSYPTSTCKPSTARPTKVPATASSACRNNAAQFSSACACAGVKPTTTTLRPRTVTVTNTRTVTATANPPPAATRTATATTRVSTTSTRTALEVSTAETTVATERGTLETTATTTTTSTTTAVETVLPTCTAYRFVVASAGSRHNGRFVADTGPQLGTDFQGVYFTAFAQNAGAYTLRSSGRVYRGVDRYGWVSSEAAVWVTEVSQLSDEDQGAFRQPYLVCSISAGGTSLPGAVGTLECEVEGTPVRFASCGRTQDAVYRLTMPTGSECVPLTLAAIPVAVTAC